jgi:multimeric flavodoxin WrbA
MKVLAINSSARIGGESKTELILNHLIKGMEEEGAKVEVVNIFKKKINYCIGCFTCWTKTPGECVHKDDMTKDLFPKYMASDLCKYTAAWVLPHALILQSPPLLTSGWTF